MRPTRDSTYWPVLPMISLAFSLPNWKKGKRISKISEKVNSTRE